MIKSLEIQRSEPLVGSAVFGSTGAYMKIVGIAKGELEPKNLANRPIADIDNTPCNAQGKVEYQTDTFVLRPSDPTKGNRRILYVVVNRGNKQLFHRIADAESDENDFQNLADLGNAFPLNRGYTIVWSGWDSTAPKAGARLVLTSPVATEAGQPITKLIRDEFAIGMRPRGDETLKLSYEAADLNPSRSRLTVRRHQNVERREVPRDRWEFADAKTVRMLPAGSTPEVGATYELHYPTKNPPLLGVGFAATRDLVSYLRYDPAGQAVTGGPISHVLAIGFSQGGRYLRDHVSQGFNRDVEGRRVFDGVLAHTAGVGRVFLNERFGQPFRTCTRHEDHDFPENAFPFSTASLSDPITGLSGSLFRGDGSDPLFIQTNTSTEYWQKGASLLHTDPQGERDVRLPPNARVYLVAGTQHGGHAGLVSKPNNKAVNPNNPHSPMPVLRALLAALDEWVVSGRPPPDSRVPTLADHTLLAPDATGFPSLPEVGIAREVNQFGPPGDWVHPTPPPRVYRPLVCKVDADGNEIAGVRTPDIAVPLGTYTGWNLYKSPFPDGELADRMGSFIAFATTRAEREKIADPRPSLVERYGNRARYVAKVREASETLVRERLLLPEDAARYVERADTETRLTT